MGATLSGPLMPLPSNGAVEAVGSFVKLRTPCSCSKLAVLAIESSRKPSALLPSCKICIEVVKYRASERNQVRLRGADSSPADFPTVEIVVEVQKTR